MIRLQTVRQDEHTLLWNVLQKYLHEMSAFYDDRMDADGNYLYAHFDEYFSDSRRTAYFLYDDDALIGFALLCPYSALGKQPDFTMAEFTIFPAFRNRHFARTAVRLILERHSGAWEIKYSERNAAAKQLWNEVAAPYSPQAHRLNAEEIVLKFDTRM